jgi:tRNA nucleotidyltransferase (CCA-adding enzyme)
VLALSPSLDRIVRQLDAAGFRALIVGGAVRDALLGLDPKDFDIEVYGVSYDQLAQILSRHGRVDLVGKSFGVVKLEGHDFSVPRRDSKTGAHHRDFLAEFDPSITPRQAASRRDFTINAMAFGPVSGELLDFFGGRDDLQNRVLRATSDAFSEDPLRVLRGMQFACRFDLQLDSATARMARGISEQYSTIATERVAEEFNKWALKSTRPGLIGPYLLQTGWISHFPEIERLRGVPQEPEWHPEGDVWIHTMHVLNAAARVAERERIAGDHRAVLMYAALTHDFAKADVTELRERGGRLRWSSYGHEQRGVPLARRFLERIGIKNSIVEQVLPLVEEHMAHTNMTGDVTPRAVRRLATRLAPASITQLLQLIEADASGRPPKPPGLPESAAKLREVASALAVGHQPPAPLILGRHVLPYFDGQAGKQIGEVTRAAYEAQLDGAFSNQAEALQWLDAFLRHSSR